MNGKFENHHFEEKTAHSASSFPTRQLLNLLVKIAGELNLALENLLVDGHRVIVIEGVNAGEHLVRQDAECPPVDGLSVALVEENFGR